MNINKNVIIADLDGTIALIEHRRHFVENGGKQWDEFFAACVDDEPNKPVIDLLKALDREGYIINIFSGRSDAVRAETEAWLKKYAVPHSTLVMRPDGDYTPDDELKKSWLYSMDKTFKSHVNFVLDDRDKVVNMWREEGLVCMQVAAGSF